MNSTNTFQPVPAPGAKAKSIGLWVLKVAFGLMFLGAGAAKLAGVQALVVEFDQVGLGQWFRYAAGLIEVIGAVLLLVPRTAIYGASLLFVVCLGALVAQLMAIHQDWVHCIVMGGLLGVVAFAERSRANSQ